jgi:hypothetical protein
MPRPLSCPVCRIDLPDGGTHCQRCGLRIAPLPRRPRKAATASGTDATSAAAIDGTAPPFGLPEALARGGLGGLALVALAALLAFAVTRGSGFVAGMSNASFFLGGIAVTTAVLLGGLRIRRLLGDVETMRRRALHGGERLAHDNVRLAFGAAGMLALGAAVALALVAR